MKGNVIGFDPETNTGAISGFDGRRYDFVTADWLGQGRPHHGDVVDFAPDGLRATQVYVLEPEYITPSFGAFYFSPSGRISRSQYWLKAVLPIWGIFLAALIVILLINVSGGAAVAGILSFLLLVYFLAMLWPLLVTHIKRIHDRNKSGWFVLIPLIPAVLTIITWAIAISAAVTSAITGAAHAGIGAIAGATVFSMILYAVQIGIAIWFFIEFGCMRGTIGANHYGPDPLR